MLLEFFMQLFNINDIACACNNIIFPAPARVIQPARDGFTHARRARWLACRAVVLRNGIVKQRPGVEVKLMRLKGREAYPRAKTRMAELFFNTRFDWPHSFIQRARQRRLQLIEA